MTRSVSYGPSITFSFGSNILHDVVDPAAAQDAATKNYVDTAAVTSGALPSFAISSGVSLQLSTTRPVHAVVPVTFSPTSVAASTCQVDLSPDNNTYTTLITKSDPASTILSGTVDDVTLFVPRAWYFKLTATNATLGTGHYY